MKRLQKEFDEIQCYKKLGQGGAHEHEELPHMSHTLAAACTENAKLKYQLNILHKVVDQNIQFLHFRRMQLKLRRARKAKGRCRKCELSGSYHRESHLYAENVLNLVSNIFAQAIVSAFGISCDPCVAPSSVMQHVFLSDWKG